MLRDTQVSREDKDEKGRKTPQQTPVYADSSEPEVVDPGRHQAPTVWMGANLISFKLLRCIEAVRDLTRILENIVGLDDPLCDKRGAKMLASPLYTLATGVRDMFNELEGNAKEYQTVSPAQHKELRDRAAQFAKQVPLDKTSDLKAVRDKIDAHVDKDAVTSPEKYWDKVNLLTFLQWIQVCLGQIMHLLTLDVYGWTRESGQPDVWSLMSVDGTLVDLYMQDDEPKAIVSVTFAKSPKYGIADEIRTLSSLCSEVLSKCRQ
jgi:hypothetical protein